MPPVVVYFYAWLRKKLRPPALDRRTRLPTRSLKEVFPGIEDVELNIAGDELYRRRGSLPLEERLSLAAICRLLKPRKIMEIGTFEGDTTATLAEHAPADCEIFTIDLDPERLERTRFPVDIGTLERVEFELGKRYRGRPGAERITQLLGDSASFDFSRFRGKVSLVFIDGNHGYENVISDSESAFEMLHPGGVVIWDDYDPALSPGVVRALNHLADSHSIYGLKGTRLAVLVAN